MKALITGIAGQDGSYLAEHLLKLGYQVFGIIRQKQHLGNLKNVIDKVTLLYGDMRDEMSLVTAILKSQPDEIYNLAGQVFVPASWVKPNETMDVNCSGLVRICKAVQEINPKIKIYQASTSEMFGNVDGFIDEETPMVPGSPYGISKVAAHNVVRIYRDSGLFVCSGILFNHESPRRGPEMVTRKISKHIADWAVSSDRPMAMLRLGANTGRDWGFAGDYVKAMHLMLQQRTPDDFVIGTGESHTIDEFVKEALKVAGIDELSAQYCIKWGDSLRTNEIKNLRANYSKAHKVLGWSPTVTFPELVNMMVKSDMEAMTCQRQIGLGCH